mmetsp:Transcript_15439/g.23305  ORF Transcript_15439/g.23305 Transcript_15439/m.23305 type:complete len:211 (-) Transcript_15439:1112-1744(-)
MAPRHCSLYSIALVLHRQSTNEKTPKITRNACFKSTALPPGLMPHWSRTISASTPGDNRPSPNCSLNKFNTAASLVARVSYDDTVLPLLSLHCCIWAINCFVEDRCIASITAHDHANKPWARRHTARPSPSAWIREVTRPSTSAPTPRFFFAGGKVPPSAITLLERTSHSTFRPVSSDPEIAERISSLFSFGGTIEGATLKGRVETAERG